MDANQFQQLINEIIQTKTEIIAKLEEIRYTLIDVETEIKKIRNRE